MSLKLRLNLIITLLLLLTIAVGATSTIHDARKNVQAEIASTAVLALHILDVEGGLMSGAGLACFLVAVLLALKRLPPSRRYVYAAFLIPIALHTQVELPFYISSSHWFLFLLFVVMQPGIRPYSIKLSVAAKKLIQITAVVGAILTTGFLSHAMAASFEFERYLLKQSPPENPFPTLMQSPYFRTMATHTVMTALLNTSMHYGIDDNVRLFAEWGGEKELEYNPHILFYRLTAQAYLYLKEIPQACSVVVEANSIYPKDKLINKWVEKCSEHE